MTEVGISITRAETLPAAPPRIGPPTYCTTWDYCTGCGLWDQIVWGKCGSCWRAEDPVIVRRTWPQQIRREWVLRWAPSLLTRWASLTDVRRWPQPLALFAIGALSAVAFGRAL